jgi:hypothetical protein
VAKPGAVKITVNGVSVTVRNDRLSREPVRATLQASLQVADECGGLRANGACHGGLLASRCVGYSVPIGTRRGVFRFLVDYFLYDLCPIYALIYRHQNYGM